MALGTLKQEANSYWALLNVPARNDYVNLLTMAKKS